MNVHAPAAAFDKPLPSPSGYAPLPPSKSYDDSAPQMFTAGRNHLAPINTSGLSLDIGPPSALLTPVTPSGPDLALPSPSADDKGRKKSNPLTDLVETEKVYVDLLTGIIRKVAAAWSRSNLPPPELDSMFRSVESVYKANRSLLGKLKEISANPSSPKALGDLLMRWIDDLEAPYTKYCTNYISGFDEWEPVQSNPRLRTTLAMFSASNPPPLPPSSPEHPPEPPLWTLDELFLLPKDRLRYYRKLYSRLLKSTTPGRSDHRLLTGALDKLDNLLATLDQRAVIKVGTLAQSAEDEVVIDFRARDSTMPLAAPSTRGSDSNQSSSNVSGSGSFSQDTTPTSVERSSTSSLSMPLTDLERRLSTERVLDIFTMQPKQVRLQIAPPNLPYTREVRLSVDVVLQVIPRSTGIEFTQERGRIFILTDLLLMCERMTSQEAAEHGPEGADMWLLYPPLAGKHLRVSAVEGSDTAVSVSILRKENVMMYAATRQMRDKIVAEFKECIESAQMLMPSKNAGPPPPVPKLPSNFGLPASPTAQRELQNAHTPDSPPTHTFSPTTSVPNMPPLSESMGKMSISNGLPQSNSPSRNPSLTGGGPGPYPQPPRSAPVGQPFGPGQIMPSSGPGPMDAGRVMSPTGFRPGHFMPNLNSLGAPNGPPPHMGGPPPHMGGPPPLHMNLPPQQYGPGPGQVIPPPRGMSHSNGPMTPVSPMPPVRNSSYSDGPSPSPQGPGMVRMHSPYPPSIPSRSPSDGSSGPGLRKSSSSRSLASQYENRPPSGPVPPMPAYPDGLAPPNRPFLARSDSSSSLQSLPSSIYSLHAKPLLPSAQLSLKSTSSIPTFADPSPPSSPVEETPRQTGPTKTDVTAQMKCKVFLKEQHQKWKSIGAAKLRLYHESPTNVKQLVVEADNNKKTILISTIVLPDGVERVGKTGVAIALSDKGLRTGIVYMLQLRDEKSASGLFDSLLAGSDRSEAH